MRPQDFDVQKVIDALQGTCDTLDSHLPEGMDWKDLSSDDHARIDDQIFLCTTCGWWYEMSEVNDNEDEYTCVDCEPKED